MQYDFDEVIERRGTGALKYEALLPRWGRDDLIPLWVADMDFRTPPFIMEAIRRRCEHEILGYTVKPRAFFEAIRDWVDRRHGWKVNASEIGFAPGIVPGISSAIQCFTEPGDKIMIQPPVYHPFAMIIRENGREIVNNPLILENGRYRMDFNHMQEAVHGCRMFILCNPHNPGGRVWSPEELRRVAEICTANGTLVVSDEIHADLTLPGRRHTVFATVSEQARMNSVTYMAPSKTFNLAGLVGSYHIVYNSWWRDRMEKESSLSHYNMMNVLSMHALIGAYKPEGYEWTDELCEVLTGNIDFACDYIEKHFEGVTVSKPQGTYMLFVDCTDWCKAHGKTIEDVEHACWDVGAAIQDGTMFFGPCHLRMNLASPRSRIEEAFHRMDKYVFNA